MEKTLVYALFTFAFVSTATPGPNNLMLLASGANFGMRRTVPHLLGIAVGIFLMISVIGLGLSQIFIAVPILEQVLIVASLAYILWLAWKIAHSAAPKADHTSARPMSFWQAAAFQWVNPKAWVMGITAQTSFASGDHWAIPFVVSTIFMLTCIPTNSAWTWFGFQMQRFLTDPRRLNAFNWGMAALLIASMLPLLFH